MNGILPTAVRDASHSSGLFVRCGPQCRWWIIRKTGGVGRRGSVASRVYRLRFGVLWRRMRYFGIARFR
jgi:hypothetical protein